MQAVVALLVLLMSLGWLLSYPSFEAQAAGTHVRKHHAKKHHAKKHRGKKHHGKKHRPKKHKPKKPKRPKPKPPCTGSTRLPTAQSRSCGGGSTGGSLELNAPPVIAAQLGAPGAPPGRSSSWVSFPATLGGFNSFQGPSGSIAGWNMLAAPNAVRRQFERGAAYVTPDYTVIQALTDERMKESIVVNRRQGTKTWSWQLHTPAGTRPQLLAGGAVDLGNGLYIPPPYLADGGGQPLNYAKLHWQLSETDVLSVTFDDAALPLPYVLDPGAAPSVFFSGFTNVTGDAYVDPAYALTRIFVNTNPGFSGSFQVNADATDDGSISQVNFPALGTGWTGGGNDTTASGGGAGIQGVYYDNSSMCNNGATGGAWNACDPGSNFTPASGSGGPGPFLRTDADIDFNWGSGTPYTELGDETFSIRWTGTLTAPETGRYYFQTVSDDGIRVYVDGTELVRAWYDQGPTTHTQGVGGSCAPTPSNWAAGSQHSVVVEFYENGGGAEARLRWRLPVSDSNKRTPTGCDTTGSTTRENNGWSGGCGGNRCVYDAVPASAFTVPGTQYSGNYSWVGGATTSNPDAVGGPETITARDTGSPQLTNTAEFRVIADTSGPTGGSMNTPNGDQTSTSANVSWSGTPSDGTAGSVSGTDTSKWKVVRRSTPYDNGDGTCDAFPAWSTATTVVASAPNGGSFNNTGLVSGNCYQWAWAVYDNVGNVSYIVDSGDPVQVDNVDPTATFGFTEVSGGQWLYASGSTMYYNRSNGTGSFSVDVYPYDASSGMIAPTGRVSFPGFGGGWGTTGPGNVNSPGPYSRQYNFTPFDTEPGGKNVTVRDNAGNTGSASFTVLDDSTAPTGQSISSTNGYVTSGSVPVTYNEGSDGGSGIDTTRTLIEYNTATLTPGTGNCGAWSGTWTTLVVDPTPSPYTHSGLTDGTCYRYRITVWDNVDNQAAVVTSAAVTKYDGTAPSASFVSWVEASPYLYPEPSTNRLWFNPGFLGESATLRIDATDTLLMNGVTFPALGGWTGPSPAALDTTGTPYEAAYAVAAGAVSGTFNAAASDAAGNVTNVPFRTQSDSAAPSSGSVTVPGGYQTTTTIPLTVTAGSDGAGSGYAGWVVNYQWAPLQNGACGGWSGDIVAATGVTSGTPSFAAADGRCYRFKIWSTDNVLNISAASAWSATQKVDATNPTVSITTPAAGGVSGTVNVTGGAGDTYSGVASVCITWTGPTPQPACQNATLTNLTPTTWSHSWNWDTSVLTEGAYTLQVKSYDNAGNVSTTQTVNVTVDNSPPTVAFTSWTESDAALHAIGRDLYYYPLAGGAHNATLNVTATDTMTGVNRVAFPNLGAAGWSAGGNDTTPSALPVPNSYSFTYTATGPGIGDPADNAAIAYDNAGAAAGSPTPLDFRIIPDAVAPTTGSVTVPGTLQTSLNIPLTVTAGSDGESGYAGWTVQYQAAPLQNNACGAYGVPATAATGTADDTPTFAAPSDGRCYQFRIVSVDNVGNTSAYSAWSATQKVDGTIPAASITTPAAGYASGTVNVTGGAGDTYSGVASVCITWTGPTPQPACQNATLTNLTSTTWSHSWNWDTTALTEGAYTLQVKSYDNAGNVSTTQTVNVTVDNTPPVAAWTSWTEASASLHAAGNVLWYNPALTGAHNATANVTATDAGAGMDRVSFPNLGAAGWSAGGDDSTVGAVPVPNSYNHTYTVTGPGAGDPADANATAYDLAGAATGSPALDFSIRPDGTAPSSGTATIPGGTQTTNSITVTVTAGTDADSGAAGWTLEVEAGTLEDNACTWSGTWTTVTTGSGNGTPADGPLASGCYHYRLTTTDNVGNSATSAVSATQKIDLADPTVGITTPAAGPNTGMIATTGTATDLHSGIQQVCVTWTGPTPQAVCQAATLTQTGPTTWDYSYDWDTGGLGLADGAYTLRVQATDRAGRTSTLQTVAVTLDNVPPLVSFTSWDETSTYLYASGADLYFNPAMIGAHNATINVTAVDLGVGMDRVSFPNLGAAGWSAGGDDTTVSAVPVPNSYSHTYTATGPGVGDPADTFAVAYDNGGAAAGSPALDFRILADSTAPSSGSATVAGATQTTNSISVTVTQGTDGGANPSGVAGWTLEVEAGTLQDDTCTWSGTWNTVSTGTGNTVATDSPVGDGCYRYRLTTTDNVANSATSAVSATQKVDLVNPTVAIGGPAAGPVSGNVALDGTAGDGQSGIQQVCVTWSGPTSQGVCQPATLTQTGPTAWDWDYSWNTTALADGAYTVNVVATDRAGRTSVVDTRNFTVDNVPPVASFYGWSESDAALHAVGSKLWYNPALTGAHSADALVVATDAGTGMNRVAFPDLLAAGWNAGGDDTTPSAVPVPDIYSHTYTATGPGVGNPADTNAVAYDNAGASTGSPALDFQIEPDGTAPAGMTLTIAGGLTNGSTIPATMTSGTETESGYQAWGTEYDLAPLEDDTCGSFSGTWNNIPTGGGVGAPAANMTFNIGGSTCIKFRMWVDDNVGNRGYSNETLVKRIDQDDPSVAITTPAAGPNTGAIATSGTATDAHSGVQQVCVTWTGPDPQGTCQAATLTQTGPTTWDYSFNWDTAGLGLADGAYTLRVQATDRAGNTSTIETVAVQLDNNPPIASWTSWDESSSYLHAVGNLLWFNPSAVGAQNATANVVATDGGSGMNRVEFPNLGAAGWSAGGTDTTPSALPVPNSYSHTYTATGPGIGNPADTNATAYDNAGAATGTPNLDFRIDPDSTAPTSGTAGVTAGLQSSATIPVTITQGTDADSGVREWALEVQAGSLQDDACAGWGAWTPESTGTGDGVYNFTAPASGCYRFRLTTTDNVSNVSAAGVVSNDRRVDLSDPTVGITTPGAGAQLSGAQSVAGTATDAHSGIGQVCVTWTGPTPQAVCQTATLTQTSPTTWDYDYSWDTTALTDGSYTISVQATDRAGHTSTIQTVAVTVDNLPPSASFYSYEEPVANPYTHWTGPAITNSRIWYNPAAPAGNYTFRVHTTATDGSGISQVAFPTPALGWNAGGNGAGPNATPTANSYHYDYTYTTPTATDPPTLTITTTDNAGNDTDTTIDIDPDAAAPTSGSAAATAGLQSGATIAVTITQGTDADSGVREWALLVDSGTLQDDTCAGWGGYAPATTGTGDSVYNYTAPASGCYRFQLTTTDNVSNTSAASAASGIVRVDLDDPTVGITTPAAGPNTGAIATSGTATDAHSGVQQVCVTWTGPDPQGTCQAATLTQTGPTTWDYSFNWDTAGLGLADGAYTLRVQATDRAGNASTIETVAVQLDNNPPIASWTSWDESSSYLHAVGNLLWFNPSAVGAQNATANVVATDGGSGMNRVEFPNLGAAGWSAGGTDTTPSALPVPNSYSHTYTATGPGIGNPADTNATAYDNAGAATGTPNLDFRIDPDSTAPTSGTAGVTAGLQSGATIPVTITQGSDADSGVREWALLVDTGTLQDDTCAGWGGYAPATTGTGDSVYNYTAPASGCYRFQLTTTDNVSNTSAASAASGIVRVDLDDPTVGITTPAAGPNSGTIATTGTATDLHSGIQQVCVTWTGPTPQAVCQTATLTQTGPTTWDYDYSWDTTAVADGSYTLRVQATDRAGRTSTVQTVSVDVDNDPPVASFHSWTESSGYLHAAGSRLWFNPNAVGAQNATANVVATDGGSGMDRVHFPDLGAAGWGPPGGDDTTVSAVPVADSWNFTYTLTGPGAGDPADADATAYDNAGANTDVAFQVDADSTAPTSGTAGVTAGLQSSATIPVTITQGSDADSGVREWALEVQAGSLQDDACAGWGAWTPESTGTGDGVYNFTAPASGCYRFRLTTTDNVSNVSAAGVVSNDRRVDLSDPTVGITTPGAGAQLSGAQSVAGTATDAHSGIGQVCVTWTGPTPQAVCQTATLTQTSPTTWDYDYSWDTTALTDGSYTISVQATDRAGHTSTIQTVAVTVDNLPPSASFYSYEEPVANPYTHWTGPAITNSRIWYNPAAPAGNYTFRVHTTATDGSGISQVAFPTPALGWNAGGNGAGPNATPTANSYHYDYTYTTPTATDPPTLTITTTDNAGNDTDTTIDIDPDTTAPAGGSVSYPDGYQPSDDVTVTLAAGADGESGIGRWQADRETGTLSGGTCSGWGGSTTIGSGTGAPPATVADTNLPDQACYRWTLTVWDNVDNPTTYTSTDEVKLDLVPPTGSITLAEGTNPQYQYLDSSTKLFVNPAQSGDFTATVAAAAASGIKDVDFPALAANFSGQTLDAVSPYTTTYSWTPTAGNPGTKNATVRSNSLGSLSLPFDVIADSAGPVNSTVTYPDVFQSTTSVNVTYVVGDDGAGSGVDLASQSLERQDGSLTNGTCGGYGGWNPVSASTPYTDNSLVGGACYRYRLALTDNVGNTSYATSTNEVKVDTTGPTAAAITLAEGTNPQYQYLANPTTLYVNSGFSGNFTATGTGTDAESGIQSVAFPDLGAAWTPVGGVVDGTAPFVTTYGWSTGADDPGAQNAVFSNGIALTTNAGFTVIDDTVAPPGGGDEDEAGGFDTDQSITIDLVNGADDAGSGIARRFVERRTVSFDVGTMTCNTGWSAWTQRGGDNPIGTAAGASGSFVDNAVVQPNCYQYRYVEIDNVGNRTEYDDGDTTIEVNDVWPPAAFDVIDPVNPALPAITTGGADPACSSVPTFADDTPDLQWNASSDADSGLNRYDVYIDGTGSVDATYAPGTTQHTAAPLAEGAHTWGVRAVDNATPENVRNSGPTFLRTVRVDSQAPTAASSSPADNAWTADSTPTLAWTASDTNCLARVRVYVDGAQVAVTGGGETSYTPAAPLADGPHTWHIEAIDSVNHATATADRTVNVDTTAPAPPTITAPTAMQTVRGFVDVTWTGSADAGAGMGTYEVRVDGVLKATVSDPTTTAHVTGITTGLHSVVVRAIDAVGNGINSLAVTFEGYPAIPVPILDAPANNAELNALPTLDWHWPSDGGPAPTDYHVLLDPAPGTPTSDVGTVLHPTSDFAIADPGDGLYRWRIEQNDPYTGTVYSTTRQFLLDRTPPTNPGPLNRTGTVVSWPAVSDPAAPIASGVDRIEFLIDDGTGYVVAATLGAGALSYDYGTLPDGNYTMKTRAYDDAGNSTDSSTINVLNDSTPPAAFTLIAPTNPVLPAITAGPAAPACAAVPTYSSLTPTFDWTDSSDAGSGLAGYDVTIDGAAAGFSPAASSEFTPGAALAAGAHSFGAVARDNFGLLRASTPANLAVRLDGAAPTVTLTAPADNGYTADTTPTLTWNNTDDNCVARAQVYVDGALADTLSSTPETYTVGTALAEGAHTWRVDVIDTVGNLTSSATYTFTVDTTAPTGITAVAPANGSSVPEAMMTFDWTDGTDTGSGIDHYILYIDGTPRATVTPSTASAFAIYAGAHTWKVRAFDAVDNWADFNFTFTATVVPDVTPPDPFNLLTPADGSTIPGGSSLTWEPAWDFKGISEYRVKVDGAQIGSVPGNQTSFVVGTTGGAPICSIDFDPATANAGCVDTPAFAAPWTVGAHGGFSVSGNSIGFDAYDGNRASTALQYEVTVPVSGGDLRFNHHYESHVTMNGGQIHSAWDGGTVEVAVSNDGGATFGPWQSTCVVGAKGEQGTSLQCDHEIMEATNGYTAILASGTGNPLAYRHVFAGDSGSMIQSKMRLSKFAGKTIRIRFRQGQDSCYVGMPAAQLPYCPAGVKKAAWQIDNIQLANVSLSPGPHSWNIVAVDPSGNQRVSAQTWNFTLT